MHKLLLAGWLLCYVSVAVAEVVPNQLRATDDAIDTAPPVFCLDAGLEIAFPSHEVEVAMGAETSGKNCLRSSLLSAVIGQLKDRLRDFSLHAIDCVLQPMDVESSTISLFGIASVCSRANLEVEKSLNEWGADTKKQVEMLFESEKKVSFDLTTGMVQHVPISPAYELPNSGSGLPQFRLDETHIWSDGDEDGDQMATSEQKTFFTHAQLNVKNDGKTPLHLYRLTLVEKSGEKSETFVLPLVTPAVVQPETSEIVSLKAITTAAVDESKSYFLYISHSGFRSHEFEGILDGKIFLAREEMPHIDKDDEGGIFDRFSLDSANAQSLFAAFPYATWQVASMSIAIMVGLAVTLYIRRKRASCRFVARGIANSLSPPKKFNSGSDGRTTAKPPSSRLASSRAAMSNRGEDHIEMETLIKKPSIPSKPSSENPSEPDKPFSSTRPKMPAITMKWKAPEATSAATKPSLTVAKAATKKLKLELDHKAKLHPKRFESMWDEYVERFQTDLSEANRPDSDKLIPNMEAHGISCMASGTVNGMEKFVFYGKQQGHSWFFLVSVDVTVATAKTVLTVRASSDAANDLVLQLVELLKTTINESVAL